LKEHLQKNFVRDEIDLVRFLSRAVDKYGPLEISREDWDREGIDHDLTLEFTDDAVIATKLPFEEI
jgi:hypothetical protein